MDKTATELEEYHDENFRNAEVVGVSVERGILVRMMDKVSRSSNLLEVDAPNERREELRNELEKYKGSINSDTANKLRENVKESREEWDTCSHAHDDDDMSQESEKCGIPKVSDCCGAGWKHTFNCYVDDMGNQKPYTCKSCGEPCEAVEEEGCTGCGNTGGCVCPLGNNPGSTGSGGEDNPLPEIEPIKWENASSFPNVANALSVQTSYRVEILKDKINEIISKLKNN